MTRGRARSLVDGLDPRRFVAVAVLGGLVISFGDHVFHVRTGTVVHHHHPQWDGQALMVVPQFIVAAALMIVAAQPAARRLPRPTPLQAIVAVALFYAAYWTTGQVGIDHPWLTLAGLLVAFAVRLALAPTPARAPIATLGVVIGIGGCLAEALNSAVGFFDYAFDPGYDLEELKVPFWLFPLYLHGAAAVAAFGAYARRPAKAEGPAGSEVDRVLRPGDDLVDGSGPGAGAEVLPT